MDKCLIVSVRGIFCAGDRETDRNMWCPNNYWRRVSGRGEWNLICDLICRSCKKIVSRCGRRMNGCSNWW